MFDKMKVIEERELHPGEENMDLKEVKQGRYCNESYRKTPKFSDARQHCCNLPKIQTKMPNLWEFHQKGSNGIALSEEF